MNCSGLDTDWQMTIFFLLALASVGLVMKFIAQFTSSKCSEARWALVCSPLLSPNSLKRSPPFVSAPRLLLRAIVFFCGTLLNYWVYWKLVRAFDIHGVLLSYLATPALWLISELLLSAVALLWLPSGRLLPPLHNRPWFARGVADFWGRRWNLWFSDWFRNALLVPLRRRPVLAVIIVFFVSGLIHEWVINVPLYFVAGKKYFGSMMLYFILQAAGLLLERHFPRNNPLAKTAFAWLVVFLPVPLLINEGLLRTLHQWPQ